MKKLSQRVKDLKEWSINNPDKITVGVTTLVLIGSAVLCRKMLKVDVTDVGLTESECDTSVDTLAINNLAIINAGEIGKEILRQHHELNPDTLVDLSIVYTADEFCE